MFISSVFVCVWLVVVVWLCGVMSPLPPTRIEYHGGITFVKHFFQSVCAGGKNDPQTRINTAFLLLKKSKKSG